MKLWPTVLLVVASVAIARADDWPLSGDVGAHDPTLLEEGGLWWCFTTGFGLPTKVSTDGRQWIQGNPLFQSEDPWWRTYAPNMGTRDVWAPDLHAYNGRIWCYYCVSEFGTNNSAIGLLSCSSIAAADWRDDGLVLGSKRGTDSFNALDPSLTIDATGRPWLVFGSWFDGIHLVPLDSATMKPSGAMVSLANRANGIEAANVVWANGYYYLFVSIDRCCLGVNSTYKIAVGRSTAITGPYVDKAGVRMLDGGGTVFDAGDARWVGPGGQDVSRVQGGWIIARHAYDARANGAPTLRISDLYWDADHWPTYLGPSAPAIERHPASVTIAPGAAFALSVAASGEQLTYVWKKDGAVVPGATGASLQVALAQPGDAGNYTVDVANATAAVESRPALVTVATPLPGRIINLSVRTRAASGDQTLIAGFVMSGSAAKALLIRGTGPTLANFGIQDVLPDPLLELYSGSTLIDANDSWLSGDRAAIRAVGGDELAGFPLVANDAVLLQTLAPGPYTAQLKDAASGQGIGLVEVYDEDPGSPGDTRFAAESALINVSARAQVGTGGDALIAGFVINGNVPRTVLIRGIGPTLAQFGVAGILPDPRLAVYDSSGSIVAQNDNWPTTDALVEIAAANGDHLGDTVLDQRDAVLLLTLPPGAYTAQVSGANGSTGVGLVDVTDED